MHWKVRERQKYHHWKKYNEEPERKVEGGKERCIIEIQSQEGTVEKEKIWKKKYQKNPEPKKKKKKRNMKKISGKSWTQKRIWKNICRKSPTRIGIWKKQKKKQKKQKQMGKSRTNYEENPKPKTEYEKIDTRKILNQKMKISKRCIKRKKNV